jgi:ribosomal protein L33
MAKKTYVLVQLVNVETPTKTKYIIKKPTKGQKQGEKLEFRKYDPVTRQHALFREKKMPSHSK